MSVVRARGPGRVNLIGEHTDYNDGLALPFAIDRGVTVTARPTDDGRITARALDFGEDDGFALEDPPENGEGWRAFVRGTVGELREAGHQLVPCELTIEGDLDQGSGLSSSAALEAALGLALLAVAGSPEPEDRRDLARLGNRVENEWVGAQTGLLDHLAALCGQEGHAVRIDFATLDVRAVPLELGDWTLVTLDSGAAHTHADSGYNERRDECRRAAEELGLDSLRDATLDAAAQLEEPLGRRVRHVVEENARVDAMVDALAEGDLEEAGRLLDASHASLRNLYEVSVPELDRTVERLKDAGAAGARLVGGGFGGSVLGLLPPGVAAPPGAVRVVPGPPARLL